MLPRLLDENDLRGVIESMSGRVSIPNNARTVRWSVDLRYQPTAQDPMPQHGAGFLVRNAEHLERVADLADWLARRPRHEPAGEPALEQKFRQSHG